MTRPGPKPGDPVARYWSKIDITGDCWLWPNPAADTGYGNITIPGGKMRSGVRGVWWSNSVQAWVVQVRHNHVRYSGGLHQTVEDADAAARALRLRLFTHNELDRVGAAS